MPLSPDGIAMSRDACIAGFTIFDDVHRDVVPISPRALLRAARGHGGARGRKDQPEGASLTYSFGHASAHRGETVSTRHDQEGYRDAVWRDILSKSRGANGSL
jgi:hypothetical protein